MRIRGYTGLTIAAAFAIAFGLTVYFTTRTPHVERGALTTGELRWAHTYAIWNGDLRARLTAAYLASIGSTQLRQVQGPLGRIADCRSSYDAQVGPAPERLKPVEASALTACREGRLSSSGSFLLMRIIQAPLRCSPCAGIQSFLFLTTMQSSLRRTVVRLTSR